MLVLFRTSPSYSESVDFCFLRKGFTMLLRLTENLQSFCFSLPCAGVASMHYCTCAESRGLVYIFVYITTIWLKATTPGPGEVGFPCWVLHSLPNIAPVPWRTLCGIDFSVLHRSLFCVWRIWACFKAVSVPLVPEDEWHMWIYFFPMDIDPFDFDLFDLAGLQFWGEIGFSFLLLALCSK